MNKLSKLNKIQILQIKLVSHSVYLRIEVAPNKGRPQIEAALSMKILS